MKNSIQKLFSFFFFPLTLLFFPALTFAQTQSGVTDKILKNLGSAAQSPFGAEASGESSVSIGVLVGRLLEAVLGFTGIIALVILIYGGFLWLTARGNEDQVTSAKKYIQNAVIGIIIIVSAFSLTYYLTEVVFEATR